MENLLMIVAMFQSAAFKLFARIIIKSIRNTWSARFVISWTISADLYPWLLHNSSWRGRFYHHPLPLFYSPLRPPIFSVYHKNRLKLSTGSRSWRGMIKTLIKCYWIQLTWSRQKPTWQSATPPAILSIQCNRVLTLSWWSRCLGPAQGPRVCNFRNWSDYPT